MVMLELLKAVDHSGTILGLLIHWPGSWRLTGAMLPETPAAGLTELDPSVTVPAGRLVGAGARY